MFKKLSLFSSFIICLACSLCSIKVESTNNSSVPLTISKDIAKRKTFPLRNIYFKISIPGKEEEKMIMINVNSREIANRLFQIYGSQTYSLIRDEKAFEEAVQKAYREVKSNRISSKLISVYLEEAELSSIKTLWEISCFLQKAEHLARLLQESISITEEEELETEKALEVIPEKRIQGIYVVVNSSENANSIYNTTHFIDNANTDLEKQKETFNKIASKFGKVKNISLRDKDYMTFEEILANFGFEFADLIKISRGVSAPISKNQSEFFVFFIDRNEVAKNTKGKIRRYAVSKKISKLTENFKKSINIEYPKNLQEDNIICVIDGMEIKVIHLLKFLELKIPGKSIKRLVGSMSQNKADVFIQTAVSSLIDLILQAKIAEEEGIKQEDFSILEVDLESFLSKIVRAFISQEDINAKYEEFRNNPSFTKRIKWNHILVESKSIASQIISNLQKAKEDNPISVKDVFKEQKKKYSVSSVNSIKTVDGSKNEFLKFFPFITDSISSEQKLDFNSISDGKVYISASGDNYNIIFIESIYNVDPTLDQLRSEIVLRIEKEKISSLLNSIMVIKVEKAGAANN